MSANKSLRETPAEAGRRGAAIVAATRSAEDKYRYARMGAVAYWGSDEERRAARLRVLMGLPVGEIITVRAFADAAEITFATAMTFLKAMQREGLVAGLQRGQRGRGNASTFMRENRGA